LGYLHGCQVVADKGFIGERWQAEMRAWTGNQIWTTKRKNQFQPNQAALGRWLASVRERIEGVFHELTNTGRDLEGLLAKTVVGLSTQVIVKMTSHALKHVLCLSFGVNVQTFEMAYLSA
jgi:hypothetical protein